MNNLFLIHYFTFTSEFLSAQCHIQYTYNASGHQMKREYVGGCGNAETFINLPHMQHVMFGFRILRYF